MLRLAGCSSGTGVCARGGCPARRCVSLAAFCARHRPALRSCRDALPSASPGVAFLLRRFALDTRLPLHLCRRVLRSASPGFAFLSPRFALVSRLLFAALRQTGRLAVSCVPVPPGRDRHSCVLVMSARLSAFAGLLRVWPFLCGDLDGVSGMRGTGLAARPLCVFARANWLCESFRREYVGAKCGSRTAAAPDCAKESNVEAALPPLWTLFTLRRGCLGACSRVCPRARLALRSWRGAFPRFTPAVCRMATNRTACGILRFYSAGSRSPFVRSRSVGVVICLCGFTLGLCVSLWRSRRGNRGRGERRTGLRGRRRGFCASLRNRIGFAAFSAGSTLGLRAPNLRQRVFDSLDSLQGLVCMAKCALRGGAMPVRIRGDSAQPAASYAAPPSYREFAPARAAQACS